MFDTHAANKFELVRDHQLKADARIQEINQKLLESRTIRAAAETKIALITNQLAALDAREAHLIALNAVNPSDQNLDELRTLRRDLKVDVAVELRVVVKAQKAQDGRRDILLHERSTLLNPITVDAFHRSPIRRFPTEVLIEIFSVTQLDEVHPVGNGPLIVLLRICRQWRTIALDTPSLWSAFSFSLFGRESEDILLSLYLRRSRAALLTIAGQHRLTLLAAHSERIYSIHFRGLSSTIFDDDDDDGPSLEAFRGRVPRLEILGASPNSDRLVGVFDIAPHLRSLIMTYSSHLRHSHPKIPYTQIQSLHLTNLPEPKDLLHYPNITSLTCSNILGWLQHRLSTSLTASRRPLSTPLILPRGPCSSRLESRRSSVGPNATSRPWSCTNPQYALARCWRHSLSPNLETLVTAHGGQTTITNRFFDALTIRQDVPMQAPRLRHLIIQGEYLFYATALVEMLETRTAPEATKSNGKLASLCRVELSISQTFAANDRERLQALKGVAVSMWEL
ncbi:hypothetical protein C8J57DRAFT_1299527 [Mycena rebaudengoi]|nr:hypothetical protein C8J57DRAFT_1299527 [Mycena rebaudengoi]